MNKEDVWVSRIPVPVRQRVTELVNDTFDNLEPGGPVRDWNIYSPQWAPVRIVDFPSAANKSLELQDRDPYDYARAVRVFPETKVANVNFKVQAGQNDTGRMEIEVMDQFGHRPVRIVLGEDGQITAFDDVKATPLAPYQAGKWHEVAIKLDVAKGSFDVSLDGQSLASALAFAEHVKSVERLSFRTGVYRTEPTLKTSTDRTPDRGSPNPDIAVPLAIYHIDDVRIMPTG
jgi:hypothetical protein